MLFLVYRYLVNVLLIVLYFSLTADAQCSRVQGCGDCFSWCVQNKDSCSSEIIQAYCPQTCNLCDSKKVCSALNCAQQCILSNDNTTARCACSEGYELDADERTCVDIDECARNATICQNVPGRSLCRNVPGDYYCSSCRELGGSLLNYYNRNECCMRNNEEKCGQGSSYSGQISFGEKFTKIRRWPWTAYLKIGDGFCSGSLITRNHIVTAGHCVYNRSLSSLQVQLGVEDVFDTESVHIQTRSVAQVYIHPEYSFPENDIAVIEIDSPAFIGRTQVSTICLPNGEEPETGDLCFSAGYSATSRPARGVLQESSLFIINNTVCENAFFNNTNQINLTSQFCADYSYESRSSCQGNSGGPLMCQRCNSCNWYLAGVTSYGINCEAPGSFGVYSKVPFFEEWIARITNLTYSPRACIKSAWHEWGPWTECSVTCGVGKRSRIRFCINGRAGNLGCIGSTNEMANCNQAACTGWSEWSQCSTTCGNGSQIRTRGEETETKVCNLLTLCPTWSDFGEWGDCSLTCGGGTRRSFRECLYGSPGESGCIGSPQREEQCNTQCCPSWSEFSPFSSCSVSCGGGVMTSNRICRCGKIGDVGCEGNETRLAFCAIEECPRFTPWTEFDSCSAQCDGGVRIRTRTCSIPGQCAPDEHGVAIEQTEICNTQPCEGRWGPFGEYGSCSVSCGGGTQSRSRKCINGVVGMGNCIGSATETKPCNTLKCLCNHLTNRNSGTSCCTKAEQGFCSLYKMYMTKNCAKTCCEYKPGQPCISRDCLNELGDNSCKLLAPWCSYVFVRSYCKASCNTC